MALAEDGNPAGSILDDPNYDPNLPWYQSLKSNWGIQIRTGINGFPSADGNGNLYLFSYEWMIPFQKAGIFSLGANLGLLPLQAPTTSIVSSNLLNPFVGAQLRYQLKVFKNQPLVPTGALTYDYYRIKNNNPVLNFVSGFQIGYSFGLMLNLTWIDQMTARDAHRSIGLTKAYLTAEIFQSEFQNAAFYLNSRFYLFGLRTEFE